MSFIDEIKFDDRGLVPAIAQDAETGDVLMMAYMNRESIEKTLADGLACYFSRSRNKLWLKGETSGNIQRVKEIRLDCDGDTLLVLIDQTGPACHTGERSCFFRKASSAGDLEQIDG
ncbi:phosphoribosyl-AMP cyclohydrolase [candidate division KSB1 bacterium]